MKSKLLTIRDAASLFGISPVTIQRWIHQGKIPFRKHGDNYLFRRSELKTWAAAHDLHLKDSGSRRQAEGSGDTFLTDTVKDSGILRSIGGDDVYTVLENVLNELELTDDKHRKDLHNQLLHREEMASTGIGRGIALPHTRSRMDLGLESNRVYIVYLEKAVDFNAMDQIPVDILFMMFTLDTQNHLKVLSRISHVLSDEKFAAVLREPGSTDEEIFAALEEAELRQ